MNLIFNAGFPVLLSVLKEERDDVEMVWGFCHLTFTFTFYLYFLLYYLVPLNIWCYGL